MTELCPAPTLAQKLAEQPLPVRDAVTVMGTVASAVEALAAHGLAPRELSPESIHLHRTRGAILDDPGVPRTLGPRAKVVSPAARGYLSPEELSGGAPMPGSLVYTLGRDPARQRAGGHPRATPARDRTGDRRGSRRTL